MGFSYSLPTDWQTADAAAPPAPSSVKEPTQRNTAKGSEKKDVACAQVVISGRHGDPASIVVVVQLPFDCIGKTVTDSDLPGIAEGASAQLKQQFIFKETDRGSYALGTHKLEIDRSRGTPKGHPNTPYTMEIICTVLKKGAVCWMAVAADDAALKAFEQSQVALEGDNPAALVPATAFDKKPPH